MKTSLLMCLLISCLIQSASAQSYKSSVPSGVMEVQIIISNTHLKIEGYEGNEVQIISKRQIKTYSRAEGLTALNQHGPDNTGVGFNYDLSDNKISLTKVSSKGEGDFLIRLPENLVLTVKENDWLGEEIMVVDMKDAITVLSNNSDIILKNVTGPITAKTTSGDIEATFLKNSRVQASDVSAVSGTVDIYLPSNLSADLNMSSISGDVYSDFELDFGNKDNHRGLEKIGGGKNTQARINGGGVKLVFSSVSDDVFVRKNRDQ